VGHRGVRGPRPENTLEAFDLAAREGADAIELDVRPTADGKLAVFHDRDLWRVAGDPRPVHEVTLSELRAVSGIDVPDLGAALDLARARAVGVNVEMKHDVPDRDGLVADVSQAIEHAGRGLELVVSCFDPGMLRAHRARQPGPAHALLVHRSAYQDVALLAARVVADGVHVHLTLVAPRTMARLCKGPRFVSVWTVNDLVVGRRAFELGADALITDEPGRLRAAFC